MEGAPKFHIVTFGCQMNKNDSERLAGLLTGLGFRSTEDETEADLIMVNTCSVRQSAEDRVYGKMRDYAALKNSNPKLVVAVTGCMVGRDKNGEFRRKMEPVDLYFPTPEMVKLPKWMAELRPDLANGPDLAEDYLKIRPARVPGAQSFVTIQTGCNRFCSYCVVPYSRGMERNRPVKDILEEARSLAVHGAVEITLLGQTVNSYRAADPDNYSPSNPYRDHFAALLWEINQLPGVERLHWTAAHPMSMSDEVIDALSLPKQANYLHLPVQSGSDEALRRMNRKYTRDKFLEIIGKVKEKRPSIALGTDIMVGFSGETEHDFEQTVSLYLECDFDISYTAQYSPRSGTLAAKLYPDDVAKEEKKRRWEVLQSLMEKTALRKNREYVGREVRVFVDKIENGSASGNTNEMKLCRFPCQDPSVIGKIVPVTVKAAMEWILLGSRHGR